MRKLIFILPILFLGLTATAQYNWTPATVTLTTGETYEGQARLNKKGYGFNVTITTVSFKSKKEQLRKTYDADELESVVFTNTYKSKIDGVRTEQTSVDKFVPVETSRYDDLIFLQEVVEGNLSLYATPLNNYKKNIKQSESPYNLGNFSIVYIKKEDTEAALITVLGLDGFIQETKAAEYLSDCPITLSFIKEQNGSVNAVQLTEYYNETCD